MANIRSFSKVQSLLETLLESNHHRTASELANWVLRNSDSGSSQYNCSKESLPPPPPPQFTVQSQRRSQGPGTIRQALGMAARSGPVPC